MKRQRMGTFRGIRKRAYRPRGALPDMSAAWRDARKMIRTHKPAPTATKPARQK